MLEKLRIDVYKANMLLRDTGLVILTWGNVSGIDRESGIFAIKPSGVEYDRLSPENMVLVDLEGRVVEGDLNPSSDTPTHLYMYRNYLNIGGITHTHSRSAVAWAQAGKSIPPLGTTHADYFNSAVLCTREMTAAEIAADYEANTGAVICECLGENVDESGAVLVKSHGPFTWGKSAGHSAENALVLEEVAAMAERSALIYGAVPPDMPKALMEKHFYRKHGKNAYYGQKSEL